MGASGLVFQGPVDLPGCLNVLRAEPGLMVCSDGQVGPEVIRCMLEYDSFYSI